MRRFSRSALVHRVLILILILTTLGPVGPFALRPQPAQAVAATSNAASSSTKRASPATPATGKVEVPERRTRTSRTYLLPDGSYQAEIAPVSLNYQDAKGAWQPIDNTLVPRTAPTIGYQNKANRYGLQLPPNLRAPVRVSLGQAWVAFTLVDAAPGNAVVSGGTASYADALPGVTVAYEAQNDAAKETLSLRDASAPHSVRYSLQLSPGLTAQVNPSGGLDIRSASGEVVFAVAAPFMVDAAGAESSAVSLALDASLNLTLTADDGWLADPARQWPVVIDPTVTAGANPDCTIDQSAPTTNWCWAPDVKVGNDTQGAVDRGLFRFDVPQALGYDEQVRVLDAELGLNAFRGPNVTVTPQVEVYFVSQFWNDQVTWNTIDGVHNWPTAGGKMDYLAAPAVAIGPINDTRYTWNLTASAQDWASGRQAPRGVLLKTTNETDNNRTFFTSSEGSDSNKWPWLTVTYAPSTGAPRYWHLEQQQLTDHLSLGVNVANGNLLLHQTDLSLAGTTGHDLVLDQWYNNRAASTSKLGPGWLLGTGADVKLAPYSNGSSVAFYGPSGYVVPFVKDGGSFTAPSGIDASLAQNADQSYTLTFNKSGEKFNFDSSGNFTSDVDKNGNTIQFNWTSGRTTSITDTKGRVTSLSYDANGRLSQIADPSPKPRTTTFGYDAAGNLITVTDTDSKVTQYAYTGSDLTRITDPRGNVTKLSYDDSHRVTTIVRVTDPVAGTGPTWTFGYNLRNPHETTVTDPNTHQTVYGYDFQGRVTKVTDGLGHAQSTTYTANSNVQSYKDAAGQTVTFQYDGQNNVTQAQYPAGASGNTPATASFSYGPAGSSTAFLPTGSTDTQGNSLAYGYDLKGNLTSLTNQLTSQNQETIEYNANGTVKRIVDPRRDAGGNAIAVTTFDYTATTWDLSKITPPAPLGASTFTTDGVSRVTDILDGNAVTTSYSYDVLDRVTKITAKASGSPTAHVTYKSYDANGNLLTLTDDSGTTNFEYDALNRMTKKTLPDKSAITYTYDGVGNLTALTDASGTVTYGYNAVNLQTSLTEPGSKTTTFGYDSNNRRTSQTYPNGVTMTMSYDLAGRLTKIEGKNAAGTVLTSFSYSYLKANTTQETSLRSSVVDKDGNTTSYSYDVLNRLTQAQTTNSGGTVTGTYQYQYDAANNILSKTIAGVASSTGITTSYGYNAASEVTNAGFSYDGDGNQTAMPGLAFGYNVLNQTTSMTPTGSAAISMAYSGATQTQRVQAGTLGFQYNLLGLGQETPGGAATRALSDLGWTSATSDWGPVELNTSNGDQALGDGRALTLNGTAYRSGLGMHSVADVRYSLSGLGCTTFQSDVGIDDEVGSSGSVAFQVWLDGVKAYDSGLLTGSSATKSLSLDVSGTSELKLVVTDGGDGTALDRADWAGAKLTCRADAASYGRDAQGQLVSQRTASGNRYYLFDGLGNTAALTDSTGSVVASYQYDPYGKVTATTGTVANPYRFGGAYGAYADSLTQLVKIGQRYYDPSLGRWTQQDPLGQGYDYAANNPVNAIDPSGLSWYSVAIDIEHAAADYAGKHWDAVDMEGAELYDWVTEIGSDILDTASEELAMADDIAGAFMGRVDADGYTIEYRGWSDGEGFVNIGSFYATGEAEP